MKVNISYRKLKSVTITGLLIGLAFIMLFLSSPAAADNGASISGTPIDYGTDNDGDGNYEMLTIDLNIEVTVPGKYFIYGTMGPSGIPANAVSKDYFDKGAHTVLLNFDGSIIYEEDKDGPYKIDISLYNKGLIQDLSYETNSYDVEAFNPAPAAEPATGTSLEVYNNTIILKTSVFVAVIYEQKPEIIFYYSIDEGKSAKFKVTYPRIIGFNDKNNNGQYDDPDEFICQADFYQVVWTSTKTLMESFESFDFEVSATMGLLDSGNELISPITVSFHYSSLANSPEDIEAARKFDINLEIFEPIEDITSFAIEHKLYDETNSHNFKLTQTAFGPKISIEDQKGSEHGYYLWKSTATAGSNGNSVEIDVGYSYDIKSSEMTLYLVYPYESDYRRILHDPAVGVNPDNQPELPDKTEQTIIRHQILLYILAFCIGGAVIVGSIYSQRKRR